ncbi:LOW QUALITY PROTEIN: vomeronasal type-2 receptor 116-like [Manis javanica]|uniref:LOW QUALITY PROTEIN: vomeronasal type-2 receptor 116-like n=1 Tax=Manis javanica TaxID=9974 RepID=UPI003C6D0E53
MPKERECCLPKSVTFQDYEDHLGMSLFCKALCFSAFTAVVQEVFAKHQDPPIVKANNRALNYILLIFIFPCFLYPFLFIDHPKTATCIPHQDTWRFFFTVAFSNVLAETVSVVLAFKVTSPGRRMTPCLCLLLCFLALGSFSVALLTRNWPNAFNEAKFLTFSLLVFCSVWVTFLPACHSVKENVPGAVEAFSISASSAGLLICIFPLKCYIIFLMSDRNTLHRLREKTHSRCNKPSFFN